MNKKTIFIAMIVGVVVIALAAVLLFQQSASQTDLNALEKQVTYYYGQNCFHCQRVLQFIQDDKIEEKMAFIKKEVSQNVPDGREFLRVVEKCGIKASEAGVPLVYAHGQCFMGEPEVMNFFKKEAGISQ